MTKEIPLTGGKEALVDDDDFEGLSKYNTKRLIRLRRNSFE